MAMVDQIVPRYVAEHANSIIEIGDFNAEISSKGLAVSGRASVRLHLGLRERLILDLRTPFESWIFPTKELDVKLEGSYCSTPIIAFDTSISPDGVRIKSIPRSGNIELCRDKRVRLKSAVLHMASFPRFCSLADSTQNFHFEADGSTRMLGRILLNHADWLIEIQELPTADEVIKELKSKGGSGLTHVIKIERSSGKSFSVSSLMRAVDDLHSFLSFARGQWTSLFGPVGYDRRNHVIYESWGLMLSTPWQYGPGWLDLNHSECMSECYDGFVEMLHNERYGEAVSAAMYWYLRSNRAGDGAGIDSGLILSQSALERLACGVLESLGGEMPRTAKDKIRTACIKLGIPTELPPHIKEFQKAKRAEPRLVDAIDIIVELRNELVHPRRRLVIKTGPLMALCWQLAQWYIEMFILKLSGYNGKYYNRLKAKWVGEVDVVPWVQAGSVPITTHASR